MTDSIVASIDALRAIIAALRAELAAKDKEIARLREVLHTIAGMHVPDGVETANAALATGARERSEDEPASADAQKTPP